MTNDERSLWERRPETEQQLAERYWPLVVNMARKWERRIGRRISAEDLAGFGAEGLMQAVRRFDLSRGMSPMTVICIRVRGAIIDGIRSDQICGYGLARQAARDGWAPAVLTNVHGHNVGPIAEAAAPEDDDDADPSGLADFLLAKFPMQDVYCVVRVYLMGQRMLDVAAELGCTESNVSRCCGQGLERLRRHLPRVLRAMGREHAA